MRKVGGVTLRSIGHISRLQRILDNDAEFVTPLDMLAELQEDNKQLAADFRAAHGTCEEHRDIATASLIEVWIDETERRAWFLFEASRNADSGGAALIRAAAAPEIPRRTSRRGRLPLLGSPSRASAPGAACGRTQVIDAASPPRRKRSAP